MDQPMTAASAASRDADGDHEMAGTAPKSASVSATVDHAVKAGGPPIGELNVSSQYMFEKDIRRSMAQRGLDRGAHDHHRVTGVQMINVVRNHLQLPMKTFVAAATFYHRLVLQHHKSEFNYNEAALACLLVACKAEDTPKKPKEIMCAKANALNPDAPRTHPDDKAYEQPAKLVIGLERIVLQTIGFDFRVRHPETLLAKLIRTKIAAVDPNPKAFVRVAFPICIDLYRTYAPLKATTWTMALAICELTAMLTGNHLDRFRISEPEERHHSKRVWVTEVLLDLLDLYTLHFKHTLLSDMFTAEDLVEAKIKINKELDRKRLPRYYIQCDGCDDLSVSKTPKSPAGAHDSRNGGGPHKSSENTKRYAFDVEEAKHERVIYLQYTQDEYEEVVFEVEEEISEHPDPPREPRGSRGQGGHGVSGRGGPSNGPSGRGGRGGPYSSRGDFDSGWRGGRARGRGGPRGGDRGGRGGERGGRGGERGRGGRGRGRGGPGDRPERGDRGSRR